MNSNYYIGKAESPNHLSVGAVLLNEKGEVACHHYPEIGGVKDVFTLMRKSLKPTESLEQAVARGLKDEFGAMGLMKGYLGSRDTTFAIGESTIQKTTLYFLLTVFAFDITLRKPGEHDAPSTIEWVAPETLITIMKAQGVNTGNLDIDEHEILELAATNK